MIGTKKLLQDKINNFNSQQKNIFFETKNSYQLFIKRTQFFETLISELFSNLNSFKELQQKVFISAVGGFGRKELYPNSDVDIFVVHKKIAEETLYEIIQNIFLPIIDCGVEVSYIFKAFDDMPDLEKELSTVTSLLNIRYITGNFELFDRWTEQFFNKFIIKNSKTYVRLKMEEYERRYQKYNQSPYILEPNIKEGIGGLREIHYIKWFAKVILGVDRFEYLCNIGLLEKYEEKLLKDAFIFLSKIRCFIHYSQPLRKEILTFNLQEEVSRFLGYKGDNNTEKVENFMADYYRNTHEIYTISKKLFHNFEVFLKKPKSFVKKELDKGVYVEGYNGGEINIYDKSIEKNPRLLFKAFFYAKKTNRRISYRTLNQIKKLSKKINIYLWDEELKKLFFDIITPEKPFNFDIFIQMYESEFLKIVVPSFGDLYHKMQFDAYHIYTIDVHSLITVKHIWQFFEKDFQGIRKKIRKPWLLVFAGLLHDIGKGYGKNHAEIGAQITENIAMKIGIDDEDRALLVFLVRKHLLFTGIAQHRDISDIFFLKKVYAKEIRSLEYLYYLYFLTIADAMSVGENVWTSWKEHLYKELLENFIFASNTINTPIEDFVKEQVAKKISHLREKIIKLDKVHLLNFLYILDEKYILSNDEETIIRDLEIDYNFLNSSKDFLCEIFENKDSKHLDIVIATKDVKGLFSQLSGALTYVGFNIVSANINTRKTGNVLDVFTVNMGKHDLKYDRKMLMDKLNNILEKIITKGEKIDELVLAKTKKYHKKSIFKEKNEVLFDNVSSEEYTVIDVFASDHMGLLFEITRTLNMLSLNIYFSKISTYGDRAVDVFYVKKDNRKILDSEMEHIRNAILKAISQ
jgi:[protein-PII] uridylyltransferase